MKKNNLIVFDIDGTLTDSVKIHQQAYTEALVDIGIEKINDDFKSYKHYTDSFIANEIYKADKLQPMSQQKIIEFEQRLTEKIAQKTIAEIKGAKHLVEHIEHATNYGVCYATGSLLRPAKHKLNCIGINYNEDVLVASDTIYERETIVSRAIENAKKHYLVKAFDKIISVGDGLWDLLTAKNLGIDFIGVGLKNKTMLKDNGAEVVLEDLTAFVI